MTNAVAQITNSISPINGLDVVNAVNGFYSGAFTNICWLLGILISLFGLAVGAIYYLLQNLQLKLQRDKLEKKFTADFEELGKNLHATNQQFLKSELEVLKKDLVRQIAHAKAGVLLVQANAQAAGDEKEEALESLVSALEFYGESGDLVWLQEKLQMGTAALKEDYVKSDFSSEKFVKEIAERIEALKAIDLQGLLEKGFDDFKHALLEAAKREKK